MTQVTSQTQPQKVGKRTAEKMSLEMTARQIAAGTVQTWRDVTWRVVVYTSFVQPVERQVTAREGLIATWLCTRALEFLINNSAAAAVVVRPAMVPAPAVCWCDGGGDMKATGPRPPTTTHNYIIIISIIVNMW